MILEKKKELRHIHHVATLFVTVSFSGKIIFLLILEFSDTLHNLFECEIENCHYLAGARRHHDLVKSCLKEPVAKELMVSVVMLMVY